MELPEQKKNIYGKMEKYHQDLSEVQMPSGQVASSQGSGSLAATNTHWWVSEC